MTFFKDEKSYNCLKTYWIDFESPAKAGDLQWGAVDWVSPLPQSTANTYMSRKDLM